MRLIIAGSRKIRDIRILREALNNSGINPNDVELIISGTALGPDRLGEQIAKEHDILVERYPADWDKFGKSAGYVRNGVMGERGDELFLLWDGLSRGSLSMRDIMLRLYKKTYVVTYTKTVMTIVVYSFNGMGRDMKTYTYDRLGGN